MKKENLVTVIIFIGMLLAGAAAFWLLSDKEFSENENRYLEQMPDISKEDLLSGDYMDAFELYAADQFPARNQLMALASSYKYLIGMRDINGAYVGNEGYLMNKTDSYSVDMERIDKNIGYLNDFFEKYQADIGTENICFMLVPESAMLLEDRLPLFADNKWEKNLMSDIRERIQNASIIEPEREMAEINGQIFYKTDHHWTTYGAFGAYKELAAHYGRNADASDYNFKEVSSSFKGSLYSKVLLPNTSSDCIVIDESCSKTRIKADGAERELYDWDALGQKDKYEVFLGGNYGIVEIEGTGEGRLLLIKDSFANSFVPFLIRDYEKIIMIDLRYYMGDVDMLMEKENITEILVLYQITNFISDENIIKLGL